MGIKQVIIDDFDGVTELPEGTEPEEVTYGGKKYKVYLSAANAVKFVDFLTGVTPLSPKSRSTGSESANDGSRARRVGSSVNRHGYEFGDVLAWAIANNKTGKGGKPISDTTKVLHQGIWDDYKAYMED